MALESVLTVADVENEGGWIEYGGLQPTIAAYDNVLILLNLLLLLK